MSNTNQVFFYVDGIPTKGTWIDVDLIDDWDEVKEALIEENICTESYDGDILAADAEGLADSFLESHGGFDLDEFIEARDTDGEDEAKRAFIECFGSWDTDGFEDSYQGEYADEEDFAREFIDEMGILKDVSEAIKMYFDYDACARDLFINDYVEHDGYVFYRNW